MRITSDKFVKDFAQTGLIESMINNLIVNVFESIARQIITAAKNDGNYQNQTGNLRNSFGFIILKGEKVVMASFPDFDKLKEMRNINYKLPPMTPEEYISNATQNIISRIDTTNEKWQLVVFSAAYYALFVELKGYNVLTDFVLDAKEVEEKFKQASYTNISASIDLSKSFQYQNIAGQTIEYRFNSGKVERRVL